MESLFKALAAGLSLWESKESRKYLDKVIKMKKEWYEEYNKERPDNNVLDTIELELCSITETFSSQVGVQNTGAKQG